MPKMKAIAPLGHLGEISLFWFLIFCDPKFCKARDKSKDVLLMLTVTFAVLQWHLH